eukprot:900723_1
MADKKEQCAWDKNDEWVMGIDEAGRGPVLGAMLYGACICPVSKLDDLKKTGVFDSKQLTDEKRRGPVLGAMLYGACICPVSKLDDLKKTGVFDSKQLTDEKRRGPVLGA